MTLEERFWSKVDVRDDVECWPWTASTNGVGYGQFFLNGRLVKAHRLAYELVVAEIPEGLQVDHLCGNRACCNPGHMELVTLVENVMRGDSPLARKARQTHCIRGHELAGENLYRDSRGRRQCRTCRRDAAQRARDRQRDAAHRRPTPIAAVAETRMESRVA